MIVRNKTEHLWAINQLPRGLILKIVTHHHAQMEVNGAYKKKRVFIFEILYLFGLGKVGVSTYLHSFLLRLSARTPV